MGSGDSNRRLFHIVRSKVQKVDITGMVVLEMTQGDVFGVENFLDTGNRSVCVFVQAKRMYLCIYIHTYIQMCLAWKTSLIQEIGLFVYLYKQNLRMYVCMHVIYI